jgi:hypothetical protein
MGSKRVGLARIEALIENLKRELALGGSQLKGVQCVVDTITADKTLTEADSGTYYMLDAADETAAVSITLPVLSADILGTHYTFTVTDPSNLGFLIKTGDLTDTSGDMFVGYLMLGADQAGDTSGAANGRCVVPGANDAVIHLDANLADSGGNIGTTIKCTAVTATRWSVEGVVITADANADGTAIFQNN